MPSTPVSTAPVSCTTPADLGLSCVHCGYLGLRIVWEDYGGDRQVRAECAACGSFHRWLNPDAVRLHLDPSFTPEEAASPARQPPAVGARWVGWLRQADDVWRPVAEAGSLGKVWDVLLHYPGDGDRLCTPTLATAGSPGDREDRPR